MILTLLLLPAALFSQSMCDCGDYELYRVHNVTTGENLTYFNVSTLMGFLSAYAENSPFVWDLNDDGIVGSSDLLLAMLGWQVAPPEFNYCDVVVSFVASSGWPATFPGTYFAIVKPTVFDEVGGTFDACPLLSWYVEVIYLDDTVVRYFFY